MFYRRKIILALTELLGGEVDKLHIQKLLFLYAVKKDQPEYEFVPYKFGAYSFSLNADLNTMVKKGMLGETEHKFRKAGRDKYFDQLKKRDQELLSDVAGNFGKMNNRTLIRYTYLNFPFYAIKSTIAKDILANDEFREVERSHPFSNKTILFTIGYEGISLENYLQKMIRNQVKLLVDVRRNPLSMKFGFSKKLLSRYCNSLGIDYIHFPELGIASSQRQSLENKVDREILFEEYRNTTLQETFETQNKLYSLLRKYQRIALTCFEAEPGQCHRMHLAIQISKKEDFNFQIVHL